jgi:FtsH-binding integral membrane protein
LLGRRQHAVSPDEYIFSALSVYLDIVMLFLQLLSIVGIASR